jgi:flagellar protein FliJ
VKRAAFRLQPVLELRRTEERAAAAAAAQAANTAADADRRAADYEQALATAVVPRLLPARARSLATAQAEQAELVRAQWTAAAQRTKGMEKLRDRHLDALQHAEDAAEERAVDDLVTGRAGRRADDAEEVPWTA